MTRRTPWRERARSGTAGSWGTARPRIGLGSACRGQLAGSGGRSPHAPLRIGPTVGHLARKLARDAGLHAAGGTAPARLLSRSHGVSDPTGRNTPATMLAPGCFDVSSTVLRR